MIQKLKMKFLAIASLLVVAAPVAVPIAVMAQTPNIHGGLCQGAELQVNPVTGACERITVNENSFNRALARVINILSIIIGIVAVIMIIWGGFKYITSGGAQDKVASAKNTLLYAIIGLIIVALAQAIVRFVLKATDESIS